MEVVQEPNHRGGAGGVPLGADALHAAAHAAAPAPAPLLLHQLLPGDVPRRGAPHRGGGLVPHQRYRAAAGGFGDGLGVGSRGKVVAGGKHHRVSGRGVVSKLFYLQGVGFFSPWHCCPASVMGQRIAGVPDLARVTVL